MKSPTFIFAFLPFLLLSCSTYEKVSRANFEEYMINSNDKENLQYVLKAHKLHYSVVDRVNKTNFYAVDESTPYYSSSAILAENIVIPTGATGLYIHSQDNQFIIDFGEGILVPFYVRNDDNRAFDKIEVDGRIYKLVSNKRKATLFFDTRSLTGSDPRHSDKKEN